MSLLLLLLMFTEHVDNDFKPKTTKKMALEKDLTIGGSESTVEDLFLTVTSRVIANSAGVMYVVDPRNFKVYIFEKDGSLRSTFGKEGPGPGEFGEPVAITLDHQENVVIFDTGTKKMNVYDPNGKFIREVRIPNGVQGVSDEVALFSNGNFLLASYKNDKDFQFAYDQSYYNPEGKEMKLVQKNSMPKLDWNRAGDPSFWREMLRDNINALGKGLPLQAKIGNDLVVVMHTSHYKGQILDNQGNVKATFSKKFKPRVFTDELKYTAAENIWQNMAANPALTNQLTQSVFEKALNDSTLPDRYFPVNSVSRLGDGFVVLSHYDPIKKEGTLDIFNPKGEFQGELPYKGNISMITGNKTHLFSVGTDEEDEVVIERYRLVK